MREIGGYFHIIYQNRNGLTGYYSTNLEWTSHRNAAKLSKNLKPWAAVFTNTNAKEQHKPGLLATYTFFRSYFAG